MDTPTLPTLHDKARQGTNMKELPPEFWIGVKKAQANHQRYGQALFNTAAELWPEKANLIAGTPADCFYTDTLAMDFLRALKLSISA